MIRKLRITVAGRSYDVEVEVLDDHGHHPSINPAPPAHISSAPVRSPGSPVEPKSSTASLRGSGAVPSPLAGKVVSVSVKVGDTVAQGNTVIVLEAMKMNTLVTAPLAGTISEIMVKPGDTVEEGQALVIIA